MEENKEIIGQNADKLTTNQKELKVVGLMTLGFLIKRKAWIIVAVALGVISAIILTYIVII